MVNLSSLKSKSWLLNPPSHVQKKRIFLLPPRTSFVVGSTQAKLEDPSLLESNALYSNHSCKSIIVFFSIISWATSFVLSSRDRSFFAFPSSPYEFMFYNFKGISESYISHIQYIMYIYIFTSFVYLFLIKRKYTNEADSSFLS